MPLSSLFWLNRHYQNQAEKYSYVLLAMVGLIDRKHKKNIIFHMVQTSHPPSWRNGSVKETVWFMCVNMTKIDLCLQTRRRHPWLSLPQVINRRNIFSSRSNELLMGTSQNSHNFLSFFSYSNRHESTTMNSCFDNLLNTFVMSIRRSMFAAVITLTTPVGALLSLKVAHLSCGLPRLRTHRHDVDDFSDDDDDDEDHDDEVEGYLRGGSCSEDSEEDEDDCHHDDNHDHEKHSSRSYQHFQEGMAYNGPFYGHQSSVLRGY